MQVDDFSVRTHRDHVVGHLSLRDEELTRGLPFSLLGFHRRHTL
jgi:hypothetical protein